MALRIPVSVERAAARAFLSLPAPVLRRIVGPERRSPDGLTLDLQLQALLWLIAFTKVRKLTGLRQTRHTVQDDIALIRRDGSAVVAPSGGAG